MAAALAIGMDEYLACPSIVARPVGVVEPLATVQPGDACRMEWVREIGGADLLEGSRPRGGAVRAAPADGRRCIDLLPLSDPLGSTFHRDHDMTRGRCDSSSFWVLPALAVTTQMNF